MTATAPHNNQVTSGSAKYLLDVFVPNHSRGLLVDALILQNVFGSGKVRILTFPSSVFSESQEAIDKNFYFEPQAEIAVFVERLFEHSSLKSYKRRAFLANPEWLTKRDLQLAENVISEFWHKTRFGMKLLTTKLPKKEHHYIGFTSLPKPGLVDTYLDFAHFPGKSKTRHTQDIINIWLKNQNLPPIAIQCYGYSLKIPKWIEAGNIRFFLGFLDEQELNVNLLSRGIHICTSQMEGFGHYINEARSIGALIITLDAPPMNELIDSSCGIVIPTKEYSQHNNGIRFTATSKAITDGILRALELPIENRRVLGMEARNRYLKEQDDFCIRLRSVVSSVINFSTGVESVNANDMKHLRRKQIFSEIYLKNAWGKSKDSQNPFYSGPGTHDPSIVSTYIESVHGFLKTFPKKPNVIDFGCGDFSVGRLIRPLCDEYIACDIVPSLIDFNRKKYSHLNVEFRISDMVCDSHPAADIAFVRQVLQHLSNSEIQDFLFKIKDRYKYIILTEHLPSDPHFVHNIDKPTGSGIRLKSGSGIVLTSPPFNLSAKQERILCEVSQYGGLIRTTLYMF